MYDGEMRMSGGSFAGCCSPLKGLTVRSAEELTDWTLALGGQLATEGYRGPYSLDLVCTQDGMLYAWEYNVRRTATTTAQAMVSRLTGGGRPAWSTGTVTGIEPMTFDETVGHLSEAGLDCQPGESEGVLPYADRPRTVGAGGTRLWLPPIPGSPNSRSDWPQHSDTRCSDPDCPGGLRVTTPLYRFESCRHPWVRGGAPDRRKTMTGISGSEGKQGFCKACGTPAGGAKLCERCRTVFPLTGGGLSVDEGAAVRRVFEAGGEAGGQRADGTAEGVGGGRERPHS
ncbi:hypothetical protein AB0H47_26230 [Streptomyces globisporus]|uniref:hypothetical protein n=1 Tax=Streptomyces globisporus TaxID=1908 RepID=UPI00345F7113